MAISYIGADVDCNSRLSTGIRNAKTPPFNWAFRFS